MPRATDPQPLTESDFDVVLIGTDLPQAILAAALSIAGSRVLHLDSNDFYGGKWATLQLATLESVIDKTESDSHDQPTSPPPVAELAAHASDTYRDCEVEPLLSPCLHDQLFPLGVHRLPSVRSHSHLSAINSCLLDLVPRSIMAAGNMIELLVRTNVGHYVDFRAIDALYVQFTTSTGLQRVPGSRADVFQNSFITMPEKRLMMRYVTRCYETISARRETNIEENNSHVEGNEDEHVSLEEDMDEMRLTPKLQTFLTHSIMFTVGGNRFSKQDGMTRVYQYQASVMRFGTKTPFLFPNFGTGELSQAFCRLCAVHGGTYVLRRGASGLIKYKVAAEESGPESAGRRLAVITSAGDVVRTKHVFMPRSLMKRETGRPRNLWHAVAVLDGSVLKSNQPERVMITIPRGTLGNSTSAVRIRQLDSAVMICPKGIFILYAETMEEGGTEQDLMKVLESYIVMNNTDGKSEQGNEDGDVAEDNYQLSTDRDVTDSKADIKPNCLWGISYARPSGESETTADNVVLMSVSEREHDAEYSVLEAQKCFKMVHPDSEFLPSRDSEKMYMANGSAHPEVDTEDTADQNEV